MLKLDGKNKVIFLHNNNNIIITDYSMNSSQRETIFITIALLRIPSTMVQSIPATAYVYISKYTLEIGSYIT